MQNILLSCMILLSFYKIKKKCHICYKYKQILVEPLPYFVGEVYFYIVVFNRCIVNSFECLRVATNQRMLSYKEVLTFLAFSSLWLNCLIGLGTWFKLQLFIHIQIEVL